ncbi:MAG: hypothetical protein KC912_24525 [Proteobacteria bacterium]|nr:hypothetical protein [Pseudomonadota bacterium]
MFRSVVALVLFAGCVPAQIEVCGDGIDNDGDGLIDPGCDEADRTELCSNFVDDDFDGIVDCDDVDCFTEPHCVVEECFDGFDNDLDGDVDCQDADCAQEARCQGGVRWHISGEAQLNETNTTYTGTKTLFVEVADNDGGLYSIGDIICSTTWGHNSGSSASLTCTDCEWALTLVTSPTSEQTGPECDYWVNFTNPESGYYYGVGTFPSGLGYNPSYSTEATTFPAVMFSYGFGGGWYALPARAEFDWDRDAHTFSWSLLWAYDYYR